MTHAFDSEVSLHSWLLWPTVRRGANGGGGGSLQHRVCLSADVQSSLNIVVGLGTYIVYDKS